MIQIRPALPTATLDSPIDHLNACHRRIEERLQTLERVGPHLLDRSAEALTAIQAVFWFFDSSGATHTADEEESFFPRLAVHLTPEEQQFLNDLELEHAQAEAIYDALKTHVAQLTNPPTPVEVTRYNDLAAELCTLYRRHIKSEDARFPAIAARILTQADLDAISKEMKHRRNL
jgi:hemerythrin-like domain-containing protein